MIDGSSRPDRRGDNADLWKVFHGLLEERGGDSARFVKVKGHAKEVQVMSGEVFALDKWGNARSHFGASFVQTLSVKEATLSTPLGP